VRGQCFYSGRTIDKGTDMNLHEIQHFVSYLKSEIVGEQSATGNI
jgi:hypothetical protein